MTQDNGMDVSPSWQELKAERDAAQREALAWKMAGELIEVHRDALAAHVEQIHRSAYYASEPPVKHVLAMGPEYSLARRDALKQAEAMGIAVRHIRMRCHTVVNAEIELEDLEAEFRRQAEEGEA